MSSEFFRVLLIEDSQTDATILARACREEGTGIHLTVQRDGQAALDQLRGSAETAPDLILLDLNLPGLDGHQVLAGLKSDPALRAIPVVVLTTSRRQEDIARTYDAGANTFIQKPAEYPGYRSLVAVLKRYWHETALRPSRSP